MTEEALNKVKEINRLGDRLNELITQYCSLLVFSINDEWKRLILACEIEIIEQKIKEM